MYGFIIEKFNVIYNSKIFSPSSFKPFGISMNFLVRYTLQQFFILIRELSYYTLIFSYNNPLISISFSFSFHLLNHLHHFYNVYIKKFKFLIKNISISPTKKRRNKKPTSSLLTITFSGSFHFVTSSTPYPCNEILRLLQRKEACARVCSAQCR